MIRCSDAKADLEIARGYVRAASRQSEVDERAARDRERETQKALRAEEAHEREQAAAGKIAQQEKAAWVVLDVDGCAKRGDARACAEIKRFVAMWPASSRIDEAAAALKAGREAVVEQQRKDEEAAKRRSTPAPAARVCCCDGSVSPTCSTAQGGCCLLHGGVCDCK